MSDRFEPAGMLVIPGEDRTPRRFPGITIPLAGKRFVSVSGDFPLTDSQWDDLMTILLVMKPGLVTAVQPEEDSQYGHGRLPLGLAITADGSLLNWQGQNYVLQPDPDTAREALAELNGDHDDSHWLDDQPVLK